MWKKLSLILMACTVALSFSVPASVDAASYKSPKRSYSPSTGSTTTPNTPNSGVNKNEPAASKSPASATNPAPAQNRGFFSGGGLLKGLMIGGLAGLLFGGLFGNMGFMGNLLGMIVNVLAFVVLFAAIRGIFVYFRNRKKWNHDPKRYE